MLYILYDSELEIIKESKKFGKEDVEPERALLSCTEL